MAKGSIKLNQRDVSKLYEEIDRSIEKSFELTHTYFKRVTPKKSGNARRNTIEKKRGADYSIIGNYDYSERLDTGWSKQAKKGMTKPSLRYLEKQLAKHFRKI